MRTIVAELRKKYFSSVKVLNRSVDNSVQKPASSIANFPYSNKLMRFALFQGTPVKLFTDRCQYHFLGRSRCILITVPASPRS